MIGWRGKLSPQVRALLDREAVVPAQPAVVRARALARARAALTAGAASRQVLESAPRRTRWAAAAVLVCLASAAAAAAAYRIGIRMKPVAAPVAVSPPTMRSEPPSRSVANAVADRPGAPLPAPSLSPSLFRADTIREELRLMRQARAAVAREDFAAALAPLGELSRRFRDGRLAEEREALRVKTLAGLGRTDEARRAAAAFEARFPRSVLLPAVKRMPASSP